VLYTYGNTISGFAIKAPNAQVLDQVLMALRADPRVGVIEQDQTIVAFADKMPNGIKRVDGGLVNMGVTDGSGSADTDVDIAIIDSGIELDNPDFNIFQSISFVDGITSGDDDIYPGYPGHGTHVAGIAAAKDNGIGIAGMAPGARLWSIKTLQFNPSTGLPEGSFTSLLAATNYVIDNADKIDVVNFSLGCLCISDILENELFQAIHKAVEKNVTFVVAAGNYHMDAGSILPANHPDVITVSSIADDDGKCGGSGGLNRILAEGKMSREADDTFASFSNYGDVVDIAAPGVKIESTYVNGNGMDHPMSGTSQAAPHVAGAAALYKNFKPQASPAEIRTELIRLGVQSTTTSCEGNGHGYFNGDKDIMPEPLLYMKNLIISIINNNPILTPNE
jgi:subtilisin family serine protease